MKKTLILMLGLTIFAALPALAKDTKKFSRPYGMAGCGLGSIVVGKSGGQIFASTTNYTGGQVFAITTGTSNCVDGPNDEVAMRMDRFVTANAAAVAGDIARGGGETVASLSSMLKCGDGAGLGSTLRKNFREIFPSADVMPNEVTDSIIAVVRDDGALSAQCKGII